MSGRLRAWGLPLLRKELVERAARKRTYWIRVAYGVVLSGLALLVLRDLLASGGGRPFAVLGRGRVLFEFLVMSQFLGIAIILPANAAGSISQEKERNSLQLLLLTDLGPWEILLEKLLASLIPMLSFLLLSLPLMGVAYSLGGVTQARLWSGVYLLLLSSLQAASLSLFFSARMSTTAGALISTYIALAAVYLLLPFLALIADAAGLQRPTIPEPVCFAMLPPYLFMSAGLGSFGGTALGSIPIAVSVSLFLLGARYFLLRRAFSKRKNLLLRPMRAIDRLADRVNNSLGGIVLMGERDALPDDRPIAWREVRRRSFGSLRYLLRITIVLAVPMILVALLDLRESYIPPGGEAEISMILIFALWGLAILAVLVMGTSAIMAERNQQTLPLLLTAPISGAEILRQKMEALRRLLLVLLVPFVSLYVIEAAAEIPLATPAERRPGGMATVLLGGATVVVYLSMFSWLSLSIGLRVRRRFPAMIVTLAVVAAWMVLPHVILMSIIVLKGNPTFLLEEYGYLFLLSPATAIFALEVMEEFRSFFPGGFVQALINNLVWHGLILLALRYHCLRNADRYLSRC
ncbi:MAG: hypothetical protein ACE5GW_02395 [Planctomycetota bacterium]